MTLHLIKLAVGVDDVDHLAELQARRLAQAGAENRAPVLRHVTRHAPRRAEELLTGGSLYWVIRGWVRVRQKLVGLDPVIGDGVRRCALVLDPLLVRTVPRAHRPFQGWRYLPGSKAPPDTTDGDGVADVPEHMAAELRELGLL